MAGLTAAGQYDYSGYMPNRPSLIRRPMPEKGSPAVRVTPTPCYSHAWNKLDIFHYFKSLIEAHG